LQGTFKERNIQQLEKNNAGLNNSNGKLHNNKTINKALAEFVTD